MHATQLEAQFEIKHKGKAHCFLAQLPNYKSTQPLPKPYFSLSSSTPLELAGPLPLPLPWPNTPSSTSLLPSLIKTLPPSSINLAIFEGAPSSVDNPQKGGSNPRPSPPPLAASIRISENRR